MSTYRAEDVLAACRDQARNRPIVAREDRPTSRPSALRCAVFALCVAATVAALASPASSASCGVQTSPDGLRVMANRDVGNERWAITQHPSGVVTGNVFRSGSETPAFISCQPGTVANQYLCMGGDGCLTDAAGGTPRAVSIEPASGLLLANKNVGSERWAITENDDGSITGNVFGADGEAPVFVFCEPNGTPDGFTCFGAGACTAEPCGNDFTLLGDVTLPADFLAPPTDCADAYDVIGDAVELPDDLFSPESCLSTCGNGLRETGEGCDGIDDALCPGHCSDACTCPGNGEIEIFVEAGSALDAGWTGTVHGLPFQRGARIAGDLTNCDGQDDTLCDFRGDIGSSCSGDASRACTRDNECSGAGQCVQRYFGPPLPLSVGGVPACILIRFTTDAVGTYDLESGEMDFSLGLNALAHLTLGGSDPCPVCDCGAADLQDCEIGDVGTCGGRSCTVEGTGAYGPTSLDCVPSASSNVTGNGIQLVFDHVTNGTLAFPSNQACTATSHQDFDCWCEGQPQPNRCGLACDGGSNDTGDCGSDGDCPGGSCVPLCRQIDGAPSGDGECIAGPLVQTCAGSPQTSCSDSGDCPAGTGPCASRNESCFPDPLVLEGVPGTTSGKLVASGCVPSAGGAMDQVAGMPGPATLTLPNTVTVTSCGDGVANGAREECDGTDDASCPGMCGSDCTCTSTCGNDSVELGEQCDGLSDAACPGACAPAGSPDACTCPASCGDGFLSAGEQCDPGGLGGSPAPSDANCPGLCLPGTCECQAPQAPQCGNQTLDPGEACEFPDLGCGLLEICLFCGECFSLLDVFPIPF